MCEEAGARGYGQRQNIGNSWANEHEELPGWCVCVCVHLPYMSTTTPKHIYMHVSCILKRGATSYWFLLLRMRKPFVPQLEFPLLLAGHHRRHRSAQPERCHTATRIFPCACCRAVCDILAESATPNSGRPRLEEFRFRVSARLLHCNDCRARPRRHLLRNMLQ